STIDAGTLSPFMGFGPPPIDAYFRSNVFLAARYGNPWWTSADLVFYTASASDITATDATEKMRITGSGNLGIGTTTPAGRLHVAVPTFTSRDADYQQATIGSGNAGYGIRFGYNESSNYGVVDVLKPSVAWGKLILQDAGGSVGIGTVSPTGSLQIE